MPVTSRRRWGTQTDASAVMAAHRPLSSAMRSNDDIDGLFIPVCCTSVIYEVFFCNNYHPLFLVYDLRQRIMMTDMAEP